MTIQLTTPAATALPRVDAALRAWQLEGGAMQLHPGDVGWFQRFGADETARSLRVWGTDAGILAIGLFDGPDVLRLTTDPALRGDAALAQAIADDLERTLPAEPVSIEAPSDAALRPALEAAGWRRDEAWTPLRRSLAGPVPHPGLDVVVVGAEESGDRVAVHRAAFENTTFTEDRWRAMADAPAYAEARCLVGYDAAGEAVAAITVWSAGAGREGLIEPMGVHREHRGHGYGTAITLAGARALRELGSSSVVVATPSGNTGGIATYRAAGFDVLAERHDLRRGD